MTKWTVEFDRIDKCVTGHEKTGHKDLKGNDVFRPVYGIDKVHHAYSYNSNHAPTISASGVWLHAPSDVSINLNTIVPDSLRIRPKINLGVES